MGKIRSAFVIYKKPSISPFFYHHGWSTEKGKGAYTVSLSLSLSLVSLVSYDCEQAFSMYVTALESLEKEIAERGEYPYLQPSKINISPSI